MADPLLINGSGGAQDKYGVIACEEIYEVDDQPTCLSYVPSPTPFNLPIIERQWRMQPHGLWHVTIKYEGVQDVTSTDGNAVYEGDSGDSEDPIETYPGIDSLVQRNA